LRWDQTDGFERLDQGTYYKSEAYAVNNSGLAVGYKVPTAGEDWIPCYWITNTLFTLSVPFTNSNGSYVKDVDDLGNMVGNVETFAPIGSMAILWRHVPSDQTVVRLADRLTENSVALAINRRGEIAGYSDRQYRAVTWIEKQPKIIGHHGIESWAVALNNLGQAVGSTTKLQLGIAYDEPVLFQNGIQLFLDRLTPANNLTEATSINDNGLIVGAGYSGSGHKVFAMTPPEVILFKNPTLTSNDVFTTTITGPAGLSCEVEATTDLATTNWANVGIVTLTNGIAQFTDTSSASFSNRFYRATSGSKISGNSVGYMVRAIPQGSWMIANPLHCADNRLTALMPSVPPGTIVWKWDAKAQNYREPNEFFEGYGWYPDEEMTIDPGEGAIVNAPFGGFTNKWVGVVIQNSVRTQVGGGRSLNGSQVAVGGEINGPLGFPAAHGDTIYRMTTGQGTFTTHTYSNGVWNPTVPTIALGEGFFSVKAAPANWRQNLSVW
jgi:hypothetical protein